ncbi:MAG: N-acetylneuraminate synthase family protein [Gammaproteobacteria bacterium]|nr:N-acetylneuraminate synthase family protein [Gammaproteobacteria bacterium]
MSQIKILAEAAQGFEGKLPQTLLLVRAAAAAGADGIKFQLVYADELATPDYRYFDLFRSLEMPDSAWQEVAQETRERNIGLLFDVFGVRGLALAQTLGVAGIKIHSTDMSNIGLLQQVAKAKLPEVILSVGGCVEQEVAEAIETIGPKPIVLMHGFQGYPTPFEANQLARIGHFACRFGSGNADAPLRQGFHDHAPIETAACTALPAVAIGAGAVVIEKHLTLSRLMKFEDHESALDPSEFAEFAARMRECGTAIGTVDGTRPDLGMHEAERRYRDAIRKHVVAVKPLAAGTVIRPEHVGLKRTASATFLSDVRQLYGKRTKTALAEGAAILESHLE